MKRFIEGVDRDQATLFPERLDDYVSDDNPARAIDAFVDALDLSALGFDVVPEATGRPGYHPATMLKIYVYGYLNQIQSSRRLERECGRNVELIWLTGSLKPDFKTIADFRKDNGPAIRNVCRQFVALCRDINLLDSASVAIDGSKFKAVNAKAKNFTREKLRKRFREIDERVGRYLSELDRADDVHSATGIPVSEAQVQRIIDRTAWLKKEADKLAAIQTEMDRTGADQISETDPDARSMAITSRHPRIIGYNVQSAVDTEHHLIVAHEVINVGSDRNALSVMANQARDALGVEKLDVVADKGYYKGEEIVTCEDDDITVTLPKPKTSNAKADGRFDRSAFIYDVEKNIYVCPAGQHLTYRMTRKERGKILHRYWTTACETCPVKHHCTPSKERRISRWEREDVLERVQKRLEDNPDKMATRRETAEHPFGTIKAWMGATHFKMRTLKRVATEMALHVLAYNMKRVIAIIGTPMLIKAITAFLSWFAAIITTEHAVRGPQHSCKAI
jgi:transposase